MDSFYSNFICGLVTAKLLLAGAANASPAIHDAPSPNHGEALLISYPNYNIDTDSFYGNTDKVGHAGVLLISAHGVTNYFEFGRYASDGKMRKVTIPNVKINEFGKATASSLKSVLSSLSKKSGQNGIIRASYFINMDFSKMKNNAVSVNPSYNLTTFNCSHFAERVVLAGNQNVDRPAIVNPTPRNVIDEYIEEGNAEVLYNPNDDSLTIGPHDENDAKN